MTDSSSAVVTAVDAALMRGDVTKLSPADRVRLLRRLAEESQLAWGAAPPITLVSAQGKLVPYITKGGADQLAQVRGASIEGLEAEDDPSGIVTYTAHVIDRDGRRNVDVGSCEYDTTRPATRARARMVAATRARRRALLGLLGSGFAWLQEAEAAVGLEDAPPVDLEELEA
jgi:hypothetical protein